MLAGSSLSMLRSAHHSIISANVHTNLIHADQFSQEEMKAQRGGVTCPISHSHLTQPKTGGKEHSTSKCQDSVEACAASQGAHGASSSEIYPCVFQHFESQSAA